MCIGRKPRAPKLRPRRTKTRARSTRGKTIRRKPLQPTRRRPRPSDRKSTRLNSSHLGISYAVFCLKKKIVIDREGLSRSQARGSARIDRDAVAAHGFFFKI